MRLGADQRGQAVQVGAILLFAALIISLASYQAVVVPQETEGVEFNDFQTATGDLATLQGAFVEAAGGTTRTVTVRTGSTYPTRTVSVNPPSPRGLLETGERREATLVNVRAAAGEANNTRNYLDGTNRSFGTRFVEFSPDYNRFDAPPVVVSGVAGFRVFDGSVSPDTAQTLMQGTRITLVTVAGDLRTRGLSAAVTVEPVSAATRTVTVTGDHGGAEPIGLRLPVSNRTTAAAWLASPINDSLPDRYVRTVEAEVAPDGREYVNITLQPDRTYSLRIARIEVRERGDSAVTDAPAEQYVIPVAGDNASVPKNQSVGLVAEVRDRFNNPVAGTNVTFAVANDDSGGALLGSTFEPATPENSTITDSEGRAAKRFSPSAAGVAYVNASFGGVGLNSTNLTVSVSPPQAGGGGGGGGGGGSYAVAWNDPDTTDANPSTSFPAYCTADNCRYDAGADSDETINLTASTSLSAAGLTVDFALNDSAIGTFTPGENTTDAAGDAGTDFTATDSGTARLYAVSGGSTGDLNLTVTSTPTADAGADLTVTEGGSVDPVLADGNDVFDPDSLLSFTWRFVSNPDGLGSFNDSTLEQPLLDIGQDADTIDDTVEVRFYVEDTEGINVSDTATVTVTDDDGGPVAGGVVGASASTNNDGAVAGSNVSFVLENTGASDATVIGVAVNSTGGGFTGNDAPEQVRRGGGDGVEVKSNRTGGSLDTTIAIGGNAEPLDTDGTVPAGAGTRFWLADFENTQGGGNFVDMSGKDVTVTVLFSDGSQATYTFNNL